MIIIIVIIISALFSRNHCDPVDLIWKLFLGGGCVHFLGERRKWARSGSELIMEGMGRGVFGSG